MITPASPEPSLRAMTIGRYPSASYFALTFAISWTGALVVVAPRLLHREPVPKFAGLMMFPVMLLGPSVSGVLLTWIASGRHGLRKLAARMQPFRFPGKWYAALLIPPTLIWCTLLLLQVRVSPVFAPNHFWIGLCFGIAAGFIEEIGWTGYAFPTMAARHNAFVSAVALGVLWGVWHLPVIDYLGTATPHGAYLSRYFLAFIVAMSAMRVLIYWIYANTGSLLLSQLMHVVSTGSLVVFSPTGVTAAQEALWYFVYAAGLWTLAAGVVLISGTKLSRRSILPDAGLHTPSNTVAGQA